MTTSRALSVGILCILSIAAGTVALWRGVAAAESPGVTGAVVSGTVVRRIQLIGNVLPRRRATVSPAAFGRVIRVLVSRGEHVRVGQPLIYLDSSRARREVERRRLALDRAKARLEQRGGDAADALDVRQAEFDLADATETLEGVVLRSPMSGTIMQLAVAEGDTMTPGGAPQVLVADPASVAVDVEADEFDAVLIRPGVRVLITSDVRPDIAIPGRILDAPSLRRARGTASTSASFSFTVEPERPLAGLTFGMSAQVEIEVSRLDNVPTVPLDSLLRLQDGYVVFELTNQGPVARAVTIGMNDDFVAHLVKGPPIGTPLLTGDEAFLRAALK